MGLLSKTMEEHEITIMNFINLRILPKVTKYVLQNTVPSLIVRGRSKRANADA